MFINASHLKFGVRVLVETELNKLSDFGCDSLERSEQLVLKTASVN